MSRRTYGSNAYETTLVSGISAVSTSVQVATTTDLGPAGYLVIDPFDPAKREVFKYTTVNGSILEDLSRGLPGSAGGTANAHDAGARVIAATTQQLIDDIFTDIEDLETADTNHASAANPHAIYLTQAEGDSLYLSVAGGVVTGPITLPGAPTIDAHAATKLYVDDSVDADIVTHAGVVGAHHTRYLDSEAVAAVTAADDFLKNTTDTLAGTLTVTTELRTNSWQAKAAGNDLVIQDGAGATILQWDDSVDEWEFKKNVDMEGHYLISPADPTGTSHVGDRGFNDIRYAYKSHTHSYLALTGGTLTGDLVLPAGDDDNATLRFAGMASNEGIYGDANEVSIAYGGSRYFTVFQDGAAQNVNVQIIGREEVPVLIERIKSGIAALDAVMMRFSSTADSQVTLNMRALKWLADNHN